MYSNADVDVCIKKAKKYAVNLTNKTHPRKLDGEEHENFRHHITIKDEHAVEVSQVVSGVLLLPLINAEILERE